MPYNLPPIACEICGKEFKPTTPRSRFCSYSCSHEGARHFAKVQYDPHREDRIRICAFPGCWKSFWSVGSQRYCRTAYCVEQRSPSAKHRIRSTAESNEYRELELQRLIQEQQDELATDGVRHWNGSTERSYMVYSLDALGAEGEEADFVGGLNCEEHDWIPMHVGAMKYRRGWAPDAWVEPLLEWIDRRRAIDSYAA